MALSWCGVVPTSHYQEKPCDCLPHSDLRRTETESTEAYCFGDDVKQLGDYAWYGKTLGSRTHLVGTKKPNAWGLYDMHGNAWEWCADGQRKYPKDETKDVIKDPKGPVDGTSRVLRGGSWSSDPRGCRSALRGADDAAGRGSNLGFRVVLRRAARTP